MHMETAKDWSLQGAQTLINIAAFLSLVLQRWRDQIKWVIIVSHPGYRRNKIGIYASSHINSQLKMISPYFVPNPPVFLGQTSEKNMLRKHMCVLAIGQQDGKQSWAEVPFRISPPAEWKWHFSLISCLLYRRYRFDGWLCSHWFVSIWNVQMTLPALAKLSYAEMKL